MAEHDSKMVIDHVQTMAQNTTKIDANTRRIVVIEKKQDNVRERLAPAEQSIEEHGKVIDNVIDKQTVLMDEVLGVRADLGNGLTIKVVAAVRTETAKLYRNITLITLVVGALVTLASFGGNAGWWG